MSGLPQVQNMFRRARLRREIVDVPVETPRWFGFISQIHEGTQRISLELTDPLAASAPTFANRCRARSVDPDIGTIASARSWKIC